MTQSVKIKLAKNLITKPILQQLLALFESNMLLCQFLRDDQLTQDEMIIVSENLIVFRGSYYHLNSKFENLLAKIKQPKSKMVRIRSFDKGTGPQIRYNQIKNKWIQAISCYNLPEETAKSQLPNADSFISHKNLFKMKLIKKIYDQGDTEETPANQLTKRITHTNNNIQSRKNLSKEWNLREYYSGENGSHKNDFFSFRIQKISNLHQRPQSLSKVFQRKLTLEKQINQEEKVQIKFVQTQGMSSSSKLKQQSQNAKPVILQQLSQEEIDFKSKLSKQSSRRRIERNSQDIFNIKKKRKSIIKKEPYPTEEQKNNQLQTHNQPKQSSENQIRTKRLLKSQSPVSSSRKITQSQKQLLQKNKQTAFVLKQSQKIKQETKIKYPKSQQRPLKPQLQQGHKIQEQKEKLGSEGQIQRRRVQQGMLKSSNKSIKKSVRKIGSNNNIQAKFTKGQEQEIHKKEEPKDKPENEPKDKPTDDPQVHHQTRKQPKERNAKDKQTTFNLPRRKQANKNLTTNIDLQTKQSQPLISKLSASSNREKREGRDKQLTVSPRAISKAGVKSKKSQDILQPQTPSPQRKQSSSPLQNSKKDFQTKNQKTTSPQRKQTTNLNIDSQMPSPQRKQSSSPLQNSKKDFQTKKQKTPSPQRKQSSSPLQNSKKVSQMPSPQRKQTANLNKDSQIEKKKTVQQAELSDKIQSNKKLVNIESSQDKLKLQSSRGSGSVGQKEAKQNLSKQQKQQSKLSPNQEDQKHTFVQRAAFHEQATLTPQPQIVSQKQLKPSLGTGNLEQISSKKNNKEVTKTQPKPKNQLTKNPAETQLQNSKAIPNSQPQKQKTTDHQPHPEESMTNLQLPSLVTKDPLQADSAAPPPIRSTLPESTINHQTFGNENILVQQLSQNSDRPDQTCKQQAQAEMTEPPLIQFPSHQAVEQIKCQQSNKAQIKKSIQHQPKSNTQLQSQVKESKLPNQSNRSNEYEQRQPHQTKITPRQPYIKMPIQPKQSQQTIIKPNYLQANIPSQLKESQQTNLPPRQPQSKQPSQHNQIIQTKQTELAPPKQPQQESLQDMPQKSKQSKQPKQKVQQKQLKQSQHSKKEQQQSASRKQLNEYQQSKKQKASNLVDKSKKLQKSNQTKQSTQKQLPLSSSSIKSTSKNKQTVQKKLPVNFSQQTPGPDQKISSPKSVPKQIKKTEKALEKKQSFPSETMSKQEKGQPQIQKSESEQQSSKQIKKVGVEEKPRSDPSKSKLQFKEIQNIPELNQESFNQIEEDQNQAQAYKKSIQNLFVDSQGQLDFKKAVSSSSLIGPEKKKASSPKESINLINIDSQNQLFRDFSINKSEQAIKANSENKVSECQESLIIDKIQSKDSQDEFQQISKKHHTEKQQNQANYQLKRARFFSQIEFPRAQILTRIIRFQDDEEVKLPEIASSLFKHNQKYKDNLIKGKDLKFLLQIKQKINQKVIRFPVENIIFNNNLSSKFSIIDNLNSNLHFAIKRLRIRSKSFIKKLFELGIMDNIALYGVWLWLDGWKSIVLDNQVLIGDGSQISIQYCWMHMLQKAILSLYSSFQTIVKVPASKFIQNMTGSPLYYIKIEGKSEDQIWQSLRNVLKQKFQRRRYNQEIMIFASGNQEKTIQILDFESHEEKGRIVKICDPKQRIISIKDLLFYTTLQILVFNPNYYHNFFDIPFELNKKYYGIYLDSQQKVMDVYIYKQSTTNLTLRIYQEIQPNKFKFVGKNKVKGYVRARLEGNYVLFLQREKLHSQNVKIYFYSAGKFTVRAESSFEGGSGYYTGKQLEFVPQK